MREVSYEPINISFLGQVAALARSHMNGSKPFERTIEQTTETIPQPRSQVREKAMGTRLTMPLAQKQ